MAASVRDDGRDDLVDGDFKSAAVAAAPIGAVRAPASPLEAVPAVVRNAPSMEAAVGTVAAGRAVGGMGGAGTRNSAGGCVAVAGAQAALLQELAAERTSDVGVRG